MRLEDAFGVLPQLYNVRFVNLAQRRQDLQNFTINKGNTGQFLERLLGLPNGCRLTDFENGELKTNKSNNNGKPLETMFITQISQDFDVLFFYDFDELNNRVFQKISNLLYLPVCKSDDNPENWYFLPAYHISLSDNQDLREQLIQDFIQIKNEIQRNLTNPNSYIHTTSGRYIQIRSKDYKGANGEYHPIHSHQLGRNVSNKNYAFYFKKQFMQDVQSGEIRATQII